MLKGRVLDFLILIVFGFGIYAAIEYGRRICAPQLDVQDKTASAVLRPAMGIEPSASLKANSHQHLAPPLSGPLLVLFERPRIERLGS